MPTRRNKAKKPRRAASRQAAKRKPAKRKPSARKAAKAKPTTARKRKTKFKVFIAWSGEKSKGVGNKLRGSLRTIVPKLEILFSPTIPPGDAWARRLQTWLLQADYAILCVTKESLNSSWMNYEAGATWKALRQANVCPLLLDLKPADLTSSPLSLFQAKQFTHEEFEELCKHLGRKTRMSSDAVRGNLDYVWGTLESEVTKILNKKP